MEEWARIRNGPHVYGYDNPGSGMGKKEMV